MLFADDFLGVGDTKDNLQRLIDVGVYNFVIDGSLKSNVNKSAVMVFSKNVENCDWMWGEHKLTHVTG